MHVPVDLGFSTLVFAVVCLAFPVFTLLIHRKWRLSVARNEEIKKLLVLASEEAARVEFEATVSYSAVPVSSNVYQCAVCYCPTTTRCAQCKSVRYCSGKCQIVHWRQGHKYECRRPTGFNDYGTDFGEEMAVKNGLDIYDASWENAPTDCASSDSSWSPELAPKPEHDARGDFISEASGMDSVSESSGTFFSGFSSTVSSGESSDEASGCESISSNEPEGPDGQSSTDVAPDVLRFSVKKKDRSESISPKFAKLADSSNNASDMTILNEFKPLGGKASNSSGPSISATFSKTNSVKVASNNCGIASESVPTILEDVNAESNTVKSVKTKLSEAEPKLHFKFNMSRTDALSSHKQRAEATSIIFEEAPSKKAAPGDFNVDVSRSFKSGNSESSTLKESDSCGKSTFSMDHEHRAGSMSSSQCASSNGGDISKVSGSTISNSNKLNLVANGTLTASQSWKSRPSSDASGCNSSSTNGRLLPNVKDVNVEDAEGSRIACNQSGSASCASSNSMGGLRSSMRKVVDQLRGAKSGRYSHKGLFPYDVFVKLYSNKVELQPCGLINCGNSCYANVVLQCLLFTPPLTAYFVLGFHSKSCATKHWCFICELENLVLKAKEGRTPLSPISILSQLQSIGSNLGNGREEDAHEFLRYAIEAMHSGCLKEAGIKAVGSVEDETTLIGLTFGGYLRSKIKCMKCHYKSERQERMMDLTVEIEGDIEKLEDALRQFTSTEILDGENKYQCSRCKSYEKAKKKLTILKAPNILTIALKRFQSGKFGKLNKPIQFPEILDLAPYMSGTSDKSPIYRLYAVIVHLDIMNASFSGHYVCYVKNSQNKWFKIDDSMVTAVELERVLTKGAYMLLYARCSPQASGLMRNGTVTPDMKTKCTASRIHPKGPSPSSASTHSSGAESQPNSVSQDNADSVESFYLKFHRLRRILEEDSSSDNYSFSSSNSDEGSCSTDSTRDSMSADDLSDYIFGGWNSSMKKAADSDACSSSSSSPLYSRHSPLSNTNRNAPGFAVMSGSWSRDGYPSSRMEHGDVWDNREANMEGGEHRFYHVKQDNNNKKKNNNNSKNCRSLGSSSSCREVEESERFGLGSNKSSSSTSTSSDVKYGVAAFRRSVSERTD